MNIWQVKVSDETAAETYLLRHVLADEQILVMVWPTVVAALLWSVAFVILAW